MPKHSTSDLIPDHILHQDVAVLNRLAASYVLFGQFENAKNIMRIVEELMPNDPVNSRMLETVLRHQGMAPK